ncbi:Do family serine endopeptidase [Arsenicitalea aurantiaca]|uniref:Probable periplasmic serine endoprotease DegP-like n=1 Tax=Arsenicitalea aurantiaca TaxID=1783274 RepID=A0A433XM37_9HYPH|nr:Do family serine endopeptidase [Arsenicitalea aurantiaca]RUT35146.1 Do family serine endopeptidase [Arsenicitalea aurantiaca]
MAAFGAGRLVASLALALMLGAGVAVPANAQVLRTHGPASVADLARELSPAVVNIGTSRRVRGGPGVPFPDLPEGSPLTELFDQLNPNRDQGPRSMREARSLGSGFFVSADGLVITNNHVIDGAEEIQVFLTDGSRLPARLVGADEKTDLAVLKVEVEREFPYVEFGDSETAEVGDWVMAIGNPFGLGGSVTLGIVSARNRDIQSGPYDNFIQTDAAINQGNSGGPLFDMDGKVVGINTAILARGGSSLGIGFAVPVNLARPVLDQLTEFGETRRGWLGVGIQEVTEDIAASLDLPNTFGALVIDITASGPSDGVIREGDIIVEFDGKAILRMRDLPRVVAETAVGRAVSVRLLRGGEEQMVDITLGRLELGEQIIAAARDEGVFPTPDAPDAPIGPAPGLPELMGFEIAPLDETARDTYAIAPDLQGVVITGVEEGSDAFDKGFLAGMVILEVNQHEVGTVADVTGHVGDAREAGRPAVLFKVADPLGTSRFVAVRLN